ncbi:DUF2637 domain-containing protein [Streptomyces sp. CS62]|uniref:DUF2637 domain-containing protein n=1 Tax=Streptomyces sp. CS62 TaxID=3119268 RepID=UPI003FA72F89
MNRSGRIALVIGLVAVVLMAFRVSWNALSDVARAIGADPTAALLYPIVIDGLMALALIATLVLTGADRTFALRVLAAYTIASLLLNYVHGLVPALHTTSVQWGRLTDWNPANWVLVLLATSLPVGSIYFGSDLVAKVLHHNPQSADPAETATAQSGDRKADQSAGEEAPQSRSDQAKPDPTQPTESTPTKVTEPPVTRPTEPDTPSPAPAARPTRSAAVAESTRIGPASGDRSGTRRCQADRPPQPHRRRSPPRGPTPDRRLERRPADRRAAAHHPTDRPETRPPPT